MVGEPRIGLGLYAPKAYVLPLYYSPSSRLLYQKNQLKLNEFYCMILVFNFPLVA